MHRRISLQQSLINHVVFVLDASASMRGKERQLIQVADDLIGFLKEQSQSYGQETRVTMYIFGEDSQAACYDVDVLRTPTIANLYEATGASTALIDASAKAINELRMSATLYGDHAFLVYVLTDGLENSSRQNPEDLRRLIGSLGENWTLAALVPDRYSQQAAVACGFTLENTAIWNATTAQGVSEVGSTIRQATQSYFQARSQGQRSVSNLFQPNVSNLTTSAVQNAQEITGFTTHHVLFPGPIREFVEQKTGRPYVTGSAYYQLTKTEEIQPQKNILIRHKFSGKVYGGREARRLLGLPDYQIKVASTSHPTYDIFVQSTSVNRKLVPGTEVIILP